MDFWDRMKNALEKGLEGSKDLLGKVKDRTQDLGERGVLRIEILQLENLAEKLVGKLGARCYEALITEIDKIHEKIREKEAAIELATRKESGE